MIGIIDYGMGNLRSVEKALRFIGQETIISSDKSELLKADKLVLPGVGAFDDAMASIEKYQIKSVIDQAIHEKKPFLGICLGMQLLFDTSEETTQMTPSKGMGVLPGEIVKIPKKEGFKVPQIGWNSIAIDQNSKLLKGIPNNSFVYFVHSYYLKAKRREDVVATIDYSVKLDVAVERDNLFAVQFHPEKSGEVGLCILKNFINI